jgi:DNA-binding transcriptional LysR family regulator
MMANGNMDLGLVDSGPDHAGVRYLTFRSSDAHAILPPGSSLADRPFLTPEDFHDQPFIALARRFPSRTQLERLFLGAGVEPRILIEVSTAVAAYEFVRAGVGMTIINPFPMSLRQDPDIRFVPFRPTIPYQTSFVLPSMMPPSAVARRFIDFVRKHQQEDGYSLPIRSV